MLNQRGIQERESNAITYEMLSRNRRRKPRKPTMPDLTLSELIEEVAEAIWENSKELNEHEPQAILEAIWNRFDTLPLNDGGCSNWKNSHKPGFPFRPVCYSKTSMTCTLGNTPNKVSRLEFEQGIRKVLGLQFTWSQLNMLQVKIAGNASCPLPFQKQHQRKMGKQNITKHDFVVCFWPYISKKCAKQLFVNSSHEKTGCPQLDELKHTMLNTEIPPPLSKPVDMKFLLPPQFHRQNTSTVLETQSILSDKSEFIDLDDL